MCCAYEALERGGTRAHLALGGRGTGEGGVTNTVIIAMPIARLGCSTAYVCRVRGYASRRLRQRLHISCSGQGLGLSIKFSLMRFWLGVMHAYSVYKQSTANLVRHARISALLWAHLSGIKLPDIYQSMKYKSCSALVGLECASQVLGLHRGGLKNTVISPYPYDVPSGGGGGTVIVGDSVSVFRQDDACTKWAGGRGLLFMLPSPLLRSWQYERKGGGHGKTGVMAWH